MAEVTLEFIAYHLAEIRDELRMIQARLASLEVTVDSFHRKLERMNDRIYKLEAQK